MFTKVFQSFVHHMSSATKKKTACRMVCKKFMNEILSTSKSAVWLLLQSIMKISGINLDIGDDLKTQLHSLASELYYYENGYKLKW